MSAIACAANTQQASEYTEPRSGSRFGDPADLVFASKEDPRQKSGPAFVRYPEGERGRGVEASFGIVFVLDTAGRAEHHSISFIGQAPPSFQAEVCRFYRNSRFVPVQRDGVLRRAFVVSEFTFTLEPQNESAPRLHVRPVDVDQLRTTFTAKGLAESVKELEPLPHCE